MLERRSDQLDTGIDSLPLFVAGEHGVGCYGSGGCQYERVGQAERTVRGAQLRCGDRDLIVDRRRRAKGCDGLVPAGFEFVRSAADSADEDLGEHGCW
jgi:hypothetical protein